MITVVLLIILKIGCIEKCEREISSLMSFLSVFLKIDFFIFYELIINKYKQNGDLISPHIDFLSYDIIVHYLFLIPGNTNILENDINPYIT